jgi:hypothetical protein
VVQTLSIDEEEEEEEEETAGRDYLGPVTEKQIKGESGLCACRGRVRVVGLNRDKKSGKKPSFSDRW